MCINVLKFGMAACVLVGLGARAQRRRRKTGDTESRDVSPFVTVRPLRPILEPCRAAPGPSSPTAARARFCAHDLGRKVTENEKIKLGEANSGPSQPVFTPDGTMARPWPYRIDVASSGSGGLIEPWDEAVDLDAIFKKANSVCEAGPPS